MYLLDLRKKRIYLYSHCPFPFFFFPSLEAAMNGRTSTARVKEAVGADKVARNYWVWAKEAGRDLSNPGGKVMPRPKRQLG